MIVTLTGSILPLLYYIIEVHHAGFQWVEVLNFIAIILIFLNQGLARHRALVRSTKVPPYMWKAS